MPEALTIVLTGGGTGGHVFPGLALADALVALRPGLRVVWVGSKGRLEETAVPRAGYAFEAIDVAFLHGRRGIARLRAAARLPSAGAAAWSVLRRHKPAAVVGVGGFASGPVGAAAWAAGVPLFLLEQNAAPGATNRILARGARCAYVTFAQAAPRLGARRVEVWGNPLRRGLARTERRSRKPGERLRVLVVGGSQGARVLNTHVPRELGAVGAGLVEVRHAAGAASVDAVRDAYVAAGVDDAQTVAFIDDMAAAYAWADVAVTRAGATTITELAAVGLPSVLVPFAAAADDHQTANARAIVDAGGGWLMSESELGSPGALRTVVRAFLDDSSIIARASDSLTCVGRTDAAARIAADILKEIER